jgi:hypothetical protein
MSAKAQERLRALSAAAEGQRPNSRDALKAAACCKRGHVRNAPPRYEGVRAHLSRCHCELDYTNPLELLIATILSAQCTINASISLPKNSFSAVGPRAIMRRSLQRNWKELYNRRDFSAPKQRAFARAAPISRRNMEAPFRDEWRN